MTTAATASVSAEESNVPRLMRAWLLTAVIDETFSSVLSKFFYGSTVTRLWQGVASVLIGAKAFEGGTTTVLLGVLMHLVVAFTWSAVFLFLIWRMQWVRRIVGSPFGVFKMAAVYGPAIWMVMSLVVIPLFAHRPPSITYRWWVQFFGHIPFVALPIVASIAKGQVRR